MLFSSTFHDLLDCALHQAILEVGIDPTIGESLLPLGIVVLEVVFIESTLICMIMFGVDEMISGELFEGEFGLDDFIAEGACHHVNIVEALEMVYKNCCCLVVLHGEFALELAKETWLC